MTNSTPSHRSAPNSSTSARWRSDILAGFQVFLIALPLSLGISLASGFPPMAGIVAAIVGGLIVSRLSGSHVTINGPAAGLIVVILHGVDLLGQGDPLLGYQLTLAAIVCAGLIQIAFGLLRMGRLATFFPIATVHGMLAGIGIIIIIKQFPVMLGVTAAKASILGMAAAVPTYIANADPLVATIGLSALAIVIIHPFIKWRAIQVIPAPIWAVGVACLIAVWSGLGSPFLVQMPVNVFSSLEFPDFSHFLTGDFITVVLCIAIIASLESLLSAAAVDKLDKDQRKSDLNRDIFAVGVGTTVSGLLGGLPMIAEIVRSSANVNAGGKTGWSNFSHGIFLLVAVLVFPSVIRAIPLAALAAILVYTGYRLSSPHEFVKTAKIGVDQLLVFMSTTIMVLATNLLVGIAIGVGVKILLHAIRRVPLTTLFRCRFDQLSGEDDTHHFKVSGPLVFSNLMGIIGAIDRVPRHETLVIDLSGSTFIDHTSLDTLTTLSRDFATAGGSLLIKHGNRHQPYSAHPLAARRLKATV